MEEKFFYGKKLTYIMGWLFSLVHLLVARALGYSGHSHIQLAAIIEFIHTARRPEQLAPQLSFDERCRLWRASVPLALQDMKRCRRPLDLIDWSVAGELA